MSYEIILISDNKQLKFKEYFCLLETENNKEFFYSIGNDFIVISGPDSTIEDFCNKKHIQFIKKILSNTYYYVIDTNSLEILKSVLISIPKNINIIIDNDHGGLMERDETFLLKNLQDLIDLKGIKLPPPVARL